MLTWQLCDFSGDPDQYCKETIQLCDFAAGGPSGSVHELDRLHLPGRIVKPQIKGGQCESSWSDPENYVNGVGGWGTDNFLVINIYHRWPYEPPSRSNCKIFNKCLSLLLIEQQQPNL